MYTFLHARATSSWCSIKPSRSQVNQPNPRIPQIRRILKKNSHFCSATPKKSIIPNPLRRLAHPTPRPSGPRPRHLDRADQTDHAC
ncbi:hypothetical protein EV356DRAFT_496112 [Viridothelium virens]|uniref:Uncharacterized protein n=1 Tax=Viridothelium virens TaxID=1048519 RepID=A0A6A6HHR0_VIRVR|nr:hypothetical protein EV356DRAFT_496112 [Viridothelium virens]